jgi:hypothetical protein
VNRDTLRRDHGHAQAAAETTLRNRIGNRYATVSLTQGHRAGFWDGVEWVLDTLTRGFDALTGGEIVGELRKREQSIYWPLFLDDERCWLDCDHCRTRQLIDAEGVCPRCGTDIE